MTGENTDTPEFPTVEKQEVYWENEGKGHSCPNCDRVFAAAQGLRMHINRAHNKNSWWNTKPTADEAQLALKREAKRQSNIRYRKRVQIVYPDPNQPKPRRRTAVAQLKYCPECGAHIENWRNDQ